MKRLFSTFLILLAALLGAQSIQAQTTGAIRTNQGFASQSLAANDDGSTGLIPLGFTINFFGKQRSAAYVNNNGNLTFDSALATYTPFGLSKTDREIIAPFFADVDTRGNSHLVTYGQDTVNGHPAFGANYINVGYYAIHTDKLNSFQVVLVDRSDTGAGNFDLEFNYAQIKWETGDASGGVSGFGGTPASVGWSNGSSDSYEFPGSLVSGAFLDGGPHSLVRQTLSGSGSTVAAPGTTLTQGRLTFRARDGVLGAGLRITNATQLPDATLGTNYSIAMAQAGGDAPYRWTFTPDVAPPPGLTFSTAGVLSGVPTAVGSYSFTVGLTAKTEDGDLTTYQRGSLTVRPAQLSILTACPLDDATVGRPYSVGLRASGASSFVWSVEDPYTLPYGLALSAAGRLAGTPLAPGTYIMNFQARSSSATDGSAPTGVRCRLNVTPAAVRLASSCSLRATTTVPYSQQLVPDGGSGAYRFDLLGQLPYGMALTSDGMVAGTASDAGSYPFQVAVTDTAGSQQVASCRIDVSAASFDVSSACPLPGAITGQAYSAKLPPSYTWSISSGGLPSGLTLSPDGSISGTPMTAGAGRFGLIATDSGGHQSGQACSLTVNRGPLSVQGCPLPDAGAGQPFSAAVSAFGGSAPYFFTFAGTLPPGIDFSTAGLLTGSTTQSGSFDFTVMVRESGGQTTAQACHLTVAAPLLHITSACPLPDASIGVLYNTQIQAAGGTAPYSFQFGGYLPDGLRGSSDGVIRGTPGSVGGRAFLIAATDATAQSVTGICSLNVGVPALPEVSFGTIPTTVASAASNVSIPIVLAKAYTQPVTGQVQLDIQADTRSPQAAANQPDPRLRFANGQLITSFTIPAGQTRVSLPLSSTGTVASTITVSITGLQVAGASLPQYPTAQIFSLPAAAPSITSACYVRTTSGIDVVLSGLSNTRELKAAAVTAGIQTFQTDVSSVASDYYSSPDTVRAGGAFSLRLSYDLKVADKAPVGDVSVYLSNSVGPTSSRTISTCP